MADQVKPLVGARDNVHDLLLYSSHDNPCPICGRTKDKDCRIRTDRELVLCHKNFGDICPDGWRYVKPAKDNRTGIFVRDYPKTDRPWGQTFKHSYRSFQGTTHNFVREYKPDRSGKMCQWEKPLGEIKETDLLPYRWDEVKNSDEIFIVEGELQVDDLIQRGISATFIRSWSDRQAELFTGKTVILMPDCDQEGINKATKARDLLQSKSAVVKWCYLPRIGNWEYLKPDRGLDSYDYFQLGGTVEELRSVITEHQTTTKTPKTFTTDSTEKRTVADQLIDLILDDPNITLWHTDCDVPYADILDDTIRRTLPIRESSFKNYLKHRYFNLTHKSPTNEALSQAIGTIESYALFDRDTHPIYLRVAEHNGKIYYDLGDDTWQAVEIDPDGWRLVSNPPVRFRRTKSLLALPTPITGGSLSQLREFINLSDEHWAIVLAFIVNALRPCVNYPVLILHGEAGTGKSTLSTLLKRLIDPSKPMLVPNIADLRNLSIYAANRHLLVYDNLSGISNDQSDALCRIATGGGFVHRKLMTDTEEIILDFVRPQILNGIDTIATRGDLLDRAYLVQLHKPDQLVDSSDYWAKFDQVYPQLLGALFTALSQALVVLPSVKVTNLPRMAEYVRLGVALEETLGLPNGEFLTIHGKIKQNSSHAAIDASPIALAILQLMDRYDTWEGYVSELYTELNNLVKDDALKRSKAWFTDVPRLGKSISRIAPDLRTLGLDISTERRNKGNWLVIKRLDSDNSPNLPTLPTLPTQPAPREGLSSVGNCVGKLGKPDLPTQPPNPDGGCVGNCGGSVGKPDLPTQLESAPRQDCVGSVGSVGKNGTLSESGDTLPSPWDDVPSIGDPDSWEGIE